MASLPEDTFFTDDTNSCLTCMDDCGGESTTVPNFNGRTCQKRNHSEMKETEDLLASEFSKLSFEERSKALDDVHCVGEELKETPAMIDQALAEFEQLVQAADDPIYAVAVNQNRSYVEARSFRLRFLRANLFNIKRSVDQMMRFLRQKALYFGQTKVAEDIDLDEMDKGVIALMRTGLMQVLKDRDRSGRVIFYNSSFDRLPADCKLETLIHFMYHVIFNLVLSVPTVQTKGVVFLHYDESKGDTSKFPGLKFLTKAISFMDTLPWRASSMHICLYSSPANLTVYNAIVQIVLGTAEPFVARTRIHCGSDLERQYKLKSFGIPLENFPVDENGNVRNEIHEAWCNEHLGNLSPSDDQQAQDNDTEPWKSIREMDVLFGRGRMAQNHSGNMRFRKILSTYAQEYDSLPRHERMTARIRYTQELLSSGTRFLRQTNTDVWVVCDFDEAVQKVSNFFRTRRRDSKRGAVIGK